MSQLQPGVSLTQNKSLSQRSTSHYYATASESSDLTDSELVKQVNDLKEQVKMLTLENEIFEKTIMRLDPALMNGVQQALEYAVKFAAKSNSSSLTVGSFTKSKVSVPDMVSGPSSKLFTSPSRVSSTSKRRMSSANIAGTIIYGTGPRINVLERSELVSQEIQIVIMNHEKLKKQAAKEHAILKAKLEEIGVRVADVDKAVANFRQEVIVDGWDRIAQRIPAEIWIRFMTEWVKTIDGQIGKLHLRTSTLNTQYHTLRGQLRAKTELNECLRPVDFEKIKIENSQCQAMMEYKWAQLEDLKQMTGDANLYLTLHKKAMVVQDNYLNYVRQTIKDRKIDSVKMDKEREVIKAMSDTLAEKLDQVQKVRLQYEVPDVMDYVGVKAELTDLKHSVKILENRLEIAKTAVMSITKKLNSIHFYKKQKSKKIKNI